jgi:hypothetical protein
MCPKSGASASTTPSACIATVATNSVPLLGGLSSNLGQRTPNVSVYGILHSVALFLHYYCGGRHSTTAHMPYTGGARPNHLHLLAGCGRLRGISTDVVEAHGRAHWRAWSHGSISRTSATATVPAELPAHLRSTVTVAGAAAFTTGSSTPGAGVHLHAFSTPLGQLQHATPPQSPRGPLSPPPRPGPDREAQAGEADSGATCDGAVPKRSAPASAKMVPAICDRCS